MNKYTEQGKLSKKAATKLQKIGQEEKRKILEYISDSLVKNSAYIIEQNRIDIKEAVKAGVKESLIDRLTLTQGRMEEIKERVLHL